MGAGSGWLRPLRREAHALGDGENWQQAVALFEQSREGFRAAGKRTRDGAQRAGEGHAAAMATVSLAIPPTALGRTPEEASLIAGEAADVFAAAGGCGGEGKGGDAGNGADGSAGRALAYAILCADRTEFQGRVTLTTITRRGRW